MTDRQKIEDRLRRKEQEIQGYEEKIRAGRVYIQALQDVLKLIDAESPGDSGTEPTLKPGSIVAQARALILKRGAPIHLNNLLAAMGKPSTREARASLTSSLAAYVRRGEIFSRPAPSTFGLLELGHVGAADDEILEPPVGFGSAGVPQDADRPAANPDDEVPF